MKDQQKRFIFPFSGLFTTVKKPSRVNNVEKLSRGAPHYLRICLFTQTQGTLKFMTIKLIFIFFS